MDQFSDSWNLENKNRSISIGSMWMLNEVLAT